MPDGSQQNNAEPDNIYHYGDRFKFRAVFDPTKPNNARIAKRPRDGGGPKVWTPINWSELHGEVKRRVRDQFSRELAGVAAE